MKIHKDRVLSESLEKVESEMFNLVDPRKRRRRDDARFRRLTRDREIRLDVEQYEDKGDREHKAKKSFLVVQAYFLCGYFKWSWKEFLDTPPWVRSALMEMLRERADDMDKFVGFDEAAGYKQLRRMFPPDKDST